MRDFSFNSSLDAREGRENIAVLNFQTDIKNRLETVSWAPKFKVQDVDGSFNLVIWLGSGERTELQL